MAVPETAVPQQRLLGVDLLHAYVKTVSANELDKAAAFYAEDGDFHSPKGSASGRQAILEFFKAKSLGGQAYEVLEDWAEVEPNVFQRVIKISFLLLVGLSIRQTATLQGGAIKRMVIARA
mmetsp:Transcript_15998/g.28456  ORF Transcript_15998/g.28456 Transcript_15998/m.28456 type:complete len:121 (-) Transcript_15998:149-511(-)|eukprot:CAMPEP_0177760146 /NCGR_PEP_ID=MMETSP0491_2-20121128/5108_1 /TAXON_ID=63592 /ORGANISM="Tetraselmis chuii, Strain PLY429" /LENGTH=120 /DNA_ID=CAMNT_0019276019 /DNA_START=346 /DNA_END=708 /DNA_ORIENTATION=-